jgi:hypothetical protein
MFCQNPERTVTHPKHPPKVKNDLSNVIQSDRQTQTGRILLLTWTTKNTPQPPIRVAQDNYSGY